VNKFPAIVLTLAASALPFVAAADPYADMQKINAAFDAQKGYHADEHFSNGQTVSVDYIPPDRIKVLPSAGGGEIVIGNDMWVNNNGKWTKMPSFMARMITGKIEQYRHGLPSGIDASSVKDLGMQTVNGKRLHAYSYVASGAPTTLWVGANDLPVQLVTSSKGITTTILYSYTNVSVESP
jgi:hypothetical protein